MSNPAQWVPSTRLLAVLLVAITATLLAATVFADDLEDETRRIAKRLQCPICESVSVADSPSDLAAQMRAVIRKKLEQGETEEQIIAYFVERYGDGVLTEPPRRGLSLAVWLGPVVVVAGGAAVLVWLTRAWLRADRPEIQAAPSPFRPNGATASRAGGAIADAYLRRAREEQEQMGGEV